MSVYIKGMEMPTSCDNCWALDDYGDYPRCRITEEQRGYNFRTREKRMDKCPLIPVPEHGRLIDASEKIRVQMYDDMTEDYHISEMTIDDLLSQGWVEADAPTIIPAEEGE